MMEVEAAATTEGNSSEIDPFSVARDVVAVGAHAAPIGFQIARTGTNFGFGIATGILGGIATGLDHLTPNGGLIFHGVNKIVEASQIITNTSLDFSEAITVGSLGITDQVFEEFAVSHGALFKVCGLQHDTAIGLVTTLKILKNHLGDVWAMGPNLALEKLVLLSALQRNFENRVEGCITDIADIDHYMTYSVGVYGRMILMFHQFHTIPDNTRDCITLLTGNDNIVYQTDSSETFRPAYAICVDEDLKRIVVCFRGTLSAVDAITDLVCDTDPVVFRGVHGHAHRGFLESGKKLVDELTPEILEIKEKYPGFGVSVCGHSLGAAAATMVAMLLLDQTDWDVQAYLFAPPCVLSESLCQHEVIQANIRGCIVGNDMVPRFGRATTRILQNQLKFMINNPMPNEQMLQNETYYREMVEQSRVTEHEQLYPCGQLFLLPTPTAHATPVANTHFNTILIQNTMLTDHLPGTLLQHLDLL